METKEQTRLIFHGVDIISINYNTLDNYSPKGGNIDLTILPKVFFPEGNKSDFKIIMEVKLNCKNIFDLSLMAIGNFALTHEVDEKIKRSFVNSNAPAIMFPYIRSFITTVSANMGTSSTPIILPTQMFNGEIEEIKPSSLDSTD